MKNNGWLGFLFFAALVVLGFVTLAVQNIDLFGRPEYIRVNFPKVQGLRQGDEVRVDGLILGRVDEIALHPNSGVNVRLKMREKVTVYEDGGIFVEAASVLGGSSVGIKRGTKGRPLDLTQLVPGKTRAGLEEISEIASENKEPLHQLITNLRDLTAALKEPKGTVGKLIQTDEVHKELTTTLKKFQETGDVAKAEIKRLGDSIQKLTEKVDTGEGPVPALLNDRKLTERLRNAMDEIEATAEHLHRIAEKVDTGEGVLAKLINDKQMGDQFKKTVENVEKTSESLRNVTGKLESGEGTIGKLLQDDELYEKAKRTLEDVDKTFGRAARAIVEIVADSKQYDDSQLNVSRLGIRISPSEDKYFFLGAAFLTLSSEGDILFEDILNQASETIIKVDAVIAYRVPWFLDRRLAVRAGMIEGKPGGGADLTWDEWLLFNHPITLSVEGRDSYDNLDDEEIDEQLNGPLFRAYAQAPIWTRRENWFEVLLSTIRLYAGVSRIGEDPEFMAGIGLEWSDDDVRTLVGLISVAR
jgi:phospholipid/cholesterol/gamma-HCH transport system substrate-binding protein